jgi:hypothetical protein
LVSVTQGWPGEPTDLRKFHRIDVAEQLGRLDRFLVVRVADPLEEQRRKDAALPGAIDSATPQDLSAVPEVGLQPRKVRRL